MPKSSPKPFCVFISAVTSEFEAARGLVASDLRARGLKVMVQEDFRQEPGADTTLRKLHNYVKDCDAVVAIMGRRSGGFPPPAAAAEFSIMLMPGFDCASRTQWEIHFARHYGKRLSFYVAKEDYKPDRDKSSEPDDPDLQDRLKRYLFDELELDRSYFSDKQELARLVLKEPWPDHSRPKPKSREFVTIGSLFKGREGEMQRLREALAGGGRAAVTAKAIHGLGGVGKTRLALEYGVAREDHYTALLFLSGETPAALEASIQSLGGVLRLPGHEELNEDERRAEVLGWLRQNPGWFLVIDNLDTPQALKAAEELLAHMAHGDAVVTSRLANFSARFTPLEVDVLSLDASVEFLLERTAARRRKTGADKEDARAIAAELGQLALALEQAGAYICRRRESFADYRREWGKESARLLGFHDATVTGYPRAVAVTFQTSFTQLSAAAKALIEHLAFLAPEPTPEDLFNAALPGIEGDLREAFDEIAGFSLASRSAEQPSFAMHRLVQEAVRRGIDEAQWDARVGAALEWLIAAIGEERPLPAQERRALLIALTLHAEALAERAHSERSAESAWYLLVFIGDAFLDVGFASTVARSQSRAFLFAKALAEGDPGNAQFQRDLSISYDRLGDLAVAAGDGKAARENFEKGLIVRKALAEGDPGNAQFQRDLSISYNKMGDLAVAAGDGKAARENFEKGLNVAKALAEGDPGNAQFQRDLIVSCVKLASAGDRPSERYREALAIAESLAGAGRQQGRDDWMVEDLRRRLREAGE